MSGTSDYPAHKILTSEHIYAALRAGASGFLLKHAPAAELLHAVRFVAVGAALLAPEVTQRLIAHYLATRQADADGNPLDRLTALTEREVEVLRLVGRGRSNREIAAELFVVEQTAKTHVSRTFTKLGLRDRAQAVVLAYETGLVRPGPSSPSAARRRSRRHGRAASPS